MSQRPTTIRASDLVRAWGLWNRRIKAKECEIVDTAYGRNWHVMHIEYHYPVCRVHVKETPLHMDVDGVYEFAIEWLNTPPRAITEAQSLPAIAEIVVNLVIVEALQALNRVQTEKLKLQQELAAERQKREQAEADAAAMKKLMAKICNLADRLDQQLVTRDDGRLESMYTLESGNVRDKLHKAVDGAWAMLGEAAPDAKDGES